MSSPLLVICFFTFLIHITESSAYAMRLAGVRTKQIAIAMSFVTSTLLISRLSNMFQAPLLGSMVDSTILIGTTQSLGNLEVSFRAVIFAGFLGSLAGAFFTPTTVKLFQKAIEHFKDHGSIPKLIFHALKPTQFIKILRSFTWPRLHYLKGISLSRIPKGFLIINIAVSSIYTIGVLCSLLAGAHLPTMRATAIQLSGIVNGMATILFTLFVDPSGARITDQACHDKRPEEDVKSVVFFLQMGRLLGTLVIAQLFFVPFTKYIMLVTTYIAQYFQ